MDHMEKLAAVKSANKLITNMIRQFQRGGTSPLASRYLGQLDPGGGPYTKRWLDRFRNLAMGSPDFRMYGAGTPTPLGSRKLMRAPTQFHRQGYDSFRQHMEEIIKNAPPQSSFSQYAKANEKALPGPRQAHPITDEFDVRNGMGLPGYRGTAHPLYIKKYGQA